MGIPSYFSHIIKKYGSVVRAHDYVRATSRVSRLYMDCNSIIYDVVHTLAAEDADALARAGVEAVIIQRVMQGIEAYIALVDPTDTAFIAFDGVAPMAKMDQQRDRRYRAQQSAALDAAAGVAPSVSVAPRFSTAAITPGTEFMVALSAETNRVFGARPRCVVSAADVPGEGEHKAFAHMRANLTSQDVVAVYGLDADLIMLALFHEDRCAQMFVFREAPAFSADILAAARIKPGGLCFLDIGALARAVESEMRIEVGAEHETSGASLVHDYVFMCFFIGNDFLPRFPAVNIRTHGMQVLFNAYRAGVGAADAKEHSLLLNGKIQWRALHGFVDALARSERDLLVVELAERDKMEARLTRFRAHTPEQKREEAERAPLLIRGAEKMIRPDQPWWHERFYAAMFGAGVRRDAVSRDASRAFVTGLAWVYSYYTNRCLSWTWRYGLPAAPLLADLATHVASVVTTGAPTFASSRPVTPTSQLMYVLPRSAHHLLPPTARTLLSDPKYAYLFPDNAPMHWAFCRWLWEAHVELPTFPVDLLEPAEMSPASLENPKISPEPPKPPKRVRVQRTRVSAP